MNVDQSANWEGRRGSEPRKNLIAVRGSLFHIDMS
jgi:hypothetical protein